MFGEVKKNKVLECCDVHWRLKLKRRSSKVFGQWQPVIAEGRLFGVMMVMS